MYPDPNSKFLLQSFKFFFNYTDTYTKICVCSDCSRFMGYAKEGISLRRDAGEEGVTWPGAAARTSAEPLSAAFCFLLSKERQILSVASVECYLPTKKSPGLVCSLWGLRWVHTSLVEQNSSNSNQAIVWIVIFFYPFLHKRFIKVWVTC